MLNVIIKPLFFLVSFSFTSSTFWSRASLVPQWEQGLLRCSVFGRNVNRKSSSRAKGKKKKRRKKTFNPFYTLLFFPLLHCFLTPYTWVYLTLLWCCCCWTDYVVLVKLWERPAALWKACRCCWNWRLPLFCCCSSILHSVFLLFSTYSNEMLFFF